MVQNLHLSGITFSMFYSLSLNHSLEGEILESSSGEKIHNTLHLIRSLFGSGIQERSFLDDVSRNVAENSVKYLIK